MITGESRAVNEAAIRRLIDDYVQAVCSKDIDGVMSVYAPELVAFDVVPPLQFKGAETYRKPWQEVFERYRDPIRYEVCDLAITAGDDVAFSHSLNRISGTLKSGQEAGFWLRWTACYRKKRDEWRIAHVQVSVPVDLRERKALLDLRP